MRPVIAAGRPGQDAAAPGTHDARRQAPRSVRRCRRTCSRPPRASLEEADRGEPRDRVDLGKVQAFAGEQEVDPGEAFRADRAVGVPRDLVHHGALCVGHLGTGRGLGQARAVLRVVVVELMARHDLARPVQLQPSRIVADHRDLEIAGPGEVQLDQGQGVVAEREVEPGRPFGGIVGERHPDRAAEACRLDHQPGVAAARGERLELTEDRVAGGRPALGADLDPVHDRQADAAAHALEQRLVHPDRRCRHARTGVGQVGRLEQRLDRAVLAERPVESDHDDRRGSSPPAGRSRDRARTVRRHRAPRGRRSRAAGGFRGYGRPAATTTDRRGRGGPASRRDRARGGRPRWPCPTRSTRHARRTARQGAPRSAR